MRPHSGEMVTKVNTDRKQQIECIAPTRASGYDRRLAFARCQGDAVIFRQHHFV